MSDLDLAAKAEELKSKMASGNPANLTIATRSERAARVPMSAPLRKLEVPEIPGFRTFWILGKPERVAQAEAAWYEFVDPSEIEVNDTRVGGSIDSGSSDMSGSRVSVIAGDELDARGQPIRLYLMKVRIEHYEQDMLSVHATNAQVAEELTAKFSQGQIGGLAAGEQVVDAQNRYVDKSRSAIPDLFKPKRRP